MLGTDRLKTSQWSKGAKEELGITNGSFFALLKQLHEAQKVQKSAIDGKWQYARRYADRLISAAELFTYLRTICSQNQPDHESLLQPLVGLEPEEAKAAWECAVQLAGGRRITARLVKAAVRKLQPTSEQPPVAREPRQAKAEKRRLIDVAIGELLVLLTQKAAHETLTQKVEALHLHFHSFFGEPKRKG